MIRVNMQITGDSAELNEKYFPRLFDGDKQIKDISIVYADDAIDVQTTIEDGKILARTIKVWAESERIRLNRELAEIQRKLEILEEV